eukprot:3786655-Amphidinium_carterae.1
MKIRSCFVGLLPAIYDLEQLALHFHIFADAPQAKRAERLVLKYNEESRNLTGIVILHCSTYSKVRDCRYDGAFTHAVLEQFYASERIKRKSKSHGSSQQAILLCRIHNIMQQNMTAMKSTLQLAADVEWKMKDDLAATLVIEGQMLLLAS